MKLLPVNREENLVVRKVLFLLAIVFCASPYSSPPLALVLGIVFAFTVRHPYSHLNSKATKLLLQISVVGLGFGMNLEKVIKAGQQGFLFTLVSIAGTLLLGFLIGKLLGIDKKASHLISSGTAICGGSAIAAVAPVINANEQEISVSLGTVFILNAIALLIFPPIGEYLHLTQNQFGIWAAIAIHDTSSVVGAAAKYGEEALQIATTIKLARALWIVPLAFFTAFVFKSKNAKISIPYFILAFVVASVLRTYLPASLGGFFESLVTIARIGLTLTLFLIGAGLSKNVLKAVGLKPLVQGVLLWIVISVASLWMVMSVST